MPDFASVSELQDFLHSSPWIVRGIFWGTLILAAFTLFLLVFVILLRIRLLYLTWHKDIFRRHWRPVLYRWLEGKRPPLPRLKADDEILMMELWLDIRDYVIGNSSKSLNQLAEKLHLDDIASEILARPAGRLFHHDIWEQLLAIRVAEAMGTETARLALIQATRSRSMSVAVAAVAGLVRVDPSAANPCILRIFLRFERWAPFIALRISRAGGSNLLHFLGSHLQHLPSDKTRMLISLAELSEDRTLVPLLKYRLTNTDDDREKTIILRALGRLGTGRETEVILPLLQDRNWTLRVGAANAMARLGEEKDIPYLRPLLKDSQWWVRFRTAQAIWILSGRNSERLNKILGETPDSEELDILTHALAEEGVSL